jgi:hypothetical protein
MAADLATLKMQLDALRAVRRSGARDVQFAERRVVFRDDAELQAQIASLENEVAAMEGAPKPRSVVIRGGKGW